jgi:YggT family protein
VRVLAGFAYLVVLVFFLLLLVRLVLDWVQLFARQWRPRGIALVVAEVTYSVTDPPLRALRRFIKPVSLGTLRLDLAFTVLMLAVLFLLNVLARV